VGTGDTMGISLRGKISIPREREYSRCGHFDFLLKEETLDPEKTQEMVLGRPCGHDYCVGCATHVNSKPGCIKQACDG